MLSRGPMQILIAASAGVLTVLLLNAAWQTGEWTGFWVTEVQMLVPFALLWQILARRRAASGE